jgi:MarR family transcriptional regulator, organic hydroperoxide resistance regulator
MTVQTEPVLDETTNRADRSALGIDEFPPLEERPTFLIHRVNAKIAQVCNPVFAKFDLDIYSSRIIVAVAQHGSMKVGSLVDLMALPQSTISHQLKRLEKVGYIRRRRADEDNRSVNITLTASGARVATICNRLSRMVYTPLAEALTSEESAMLAQLLERIFNAIPESEDLQV